MFLRLTLFFIIILSVLGEPAFNQFEGEVLFRVFNTDQQSEQITQMGLTFTEDRIFVDSNATVDVMAGLRAQGVLVRHDLQDFVVITDQQEALKVSKSDLENLGNLLNRMRGHEEVAEKQAFPWEERLEETGNERNILGYDAQQFILKGNKEGEYASVWLTDEISVKWGLLSDAWYTIGSKQMDQEVPIEVVMNNRSFPLLVEAYENEHLVFKAEAFAINNDSFDRSKTELSSNMKLIGLTDLMMNMFRQN